MKIRLQHVVATTAAMTASVPAWAHGGEERITPANWARAWSWEPLVVAGLAVSALLFGAGVARLWRRSSPQRTFAVWRVWAFSAGWLTLALALVSPLHELGGELFSVHMAQHELLMLVAAPLLVLGRPLIPMLWGLPEPIRRRAGSVLNVSVVSRTWDAITNPVAAWLVFGTALWIWHAPWLYQATLGSEWVHGLQHTTFLVTALLFWWALIEGRYGRQGYGMAILYVFTTAVHSSVLGALFTFADRLWYPAYASRTAAWGLTALQDQQIGGLIMWVPSGAVLIGVALAFLGAWLRESDRRLAYTQAVMAVQRGDTHA